MGFLSTLAGLGIKDVLSGVGGLAKDIREAITGEVSADAKAAINTKLLELEALSIQGDIKLDEFRRDVIVAEANGHSWLQRNWRPVLMLWFAGLVGAYWFGYTQPNLPESTVLELLGIVKIGIGGYVVGRSVEKIADKVSFK